MSSFFHSLTSADWLDICGILLVTIGVAGELLMIFDWSKQLLRLPYNPTDFPPLDFRKQLWEKIFSGMVVIGLVFEVWALPEHMTESAQLNKDASLARLEIANLKQPRTLTEEQKGVIEKSLNGTTRGNIIVRHVILGDAPNFAFVLELEFALMGYNVSPPILDSPYKNFISYVPPKLSKFEGVEVVFNDKQPAYGLKIEEALTKAGISVRHFPDSSLDSNTVEFEVFERP